MAERLEGLRCRRGYALAEAEGLKAAIRLAFGSMVQNVNGF